jgi:hypothetical protein
MFRLLVGAAGGAAVLGGILLVTLAYGGVRHTELCPSRPEMGDIAGLWPREAGEFSDAIAGHSSYLAGTDLREGNRLRSVRVERNDVIVSVDGTNRWSSPETPGSVWQLVYARHHGGFSGGGLPCVKIDIVAGDGRITHWAWASADLNVL